MNTDKKVRNLNVLMVARFSTRKRKYLTSTIVARNYTKTSRKCSSGNGERAASQLGRRHKRLNTLNFQTWKRQALSLQQKLKHRAPQQQKSAIALNAPTFYIVPKHKQYAI